MNTATSAAAGWAQTAFPPSQAHPCLPVLIAGLVGSEIVTAALADPALRERVTPALDPHRAPPADALLWRLETASGSALCQPGLIDELWHRPPYAVTLRLVQYQPGALQGDVLDEGTLGTRGPRRSFQAALERLCMRFVRDAALGRSRGVAGCAPAEAPHGRDGWLDFQRAQWRERLLTEWWSPGSAEARFEAVLSGQGLGPVQWLQETAGTRYLADPFPWPNTGRLLCEEMPVVHGVGRIVAVSVDAGKARTTRVLLEDGEHHSYPCTLQEDDTVFCVPEAPQRGATRVYRLGADGGLVPAAEPAPHRRLADPTLFRHDGLYWIACTDLDIGEHDNLCLLWAHDIGGPWTAHARWPVKIDIRSARPAGNLFRWQDQLFRPAQDCAATYGAAVSIQRIDRLSVDDFAEFPVTVLRPDKTGPFPDGLHTLVHDGERFWVDGKRFVFNPATAGRKLAERLLRHCFASGAE